MKILFVATKKNGDPSERELYEMDFMNELLGFRRSLFDLGLLTVAGGTPKDVEVELVDEYVQPIPYETTDADLIALSAKTSCVAHAYDVASRFRRRGIPVVLGGIHASLRPEEALEHVDYVVVGEAERTWPAFVEAFRRGEAPKITKETEFPPMDIIPIPAWDKIDPGQFLFHQIQTTRGCPYTCRFCSVPDISGSTFRFKPVEKVVEEIRALPSAGFLKDKLKALYIVDDNFISRLKYTKELLEALAPLHKSGELGEWSAETTLNVAKDEELLDMFAAAGCSTLIIGFESVSEATLLDMKKKVNFSLSYPEAIGRIHARGMSIVGNFIVGFDTDTLSVFREILDFVDTHTILYPFFSILTPMPGTQLFEEFNAAGRLDHTDWKRFDTRHVVFGPKNMSRDQLMDGYVWLYEQAYTTPKAFDRLERYWRTHRKVESTAVERAFIKWKLRKFEKSGTPRFKRVLADGWARLTAPGVRSDVGQLLYYYDSAHFVDFLSRFKSARFEEHTQIFESHRLVEDAELERKQWNRKKKLPVVENRDAPLAG